MKPVNTASDDERLLCVFRALANPVRFRMVKYMVEHPQCITGDLAAFSHLAQSTTSQHLAVLRDAGVVRGSIEGTARCYCLDQATLEWFRGRVASWADQMAAYRQAALGDLAPRSACSTQPATTAERSSSHGH